MASALDLAGALRGLETDTLDERLRSRVIARPATVHDAFDLADALLEPASVRDALSRLDRVELLVLQAVRVPLRGDAVHPEIDADFTVAPESVVHALAHLESLFLVVSRDDTFSALEPVARLLDDDPNLSADSLGSELPPTVLEAVDDVDLADLDRRSAERLYAVVVEVAEIVRAVTAAPARELAKGGLALPETRRLADAAKVDVADVAPIVAAAASAGLLELHDDGWAPTSEAAGWLSSSWAERWARLVGAWLKALPREIKVVLDERADTSWGEPLLAFSIWFFPDGGAWLPERIDAFGRSAALFGLTLDGHPTSAAVALVREGPDAASEIVGELMPQPIDKVYLQHDLTVVAPGPLAPDLDGRLRTIAAVESAGLAATYRITDSALQSALSAGETEASLREFLSDLSSTGIPQPLDYLLTETAARHGRYRVTSLDPTEMRADASYGAESQVRCDDSALVDTLQVDQALGPLALRRLDALRVVSRFDAETVYWALHDQRYPVVLEDAEAVPLRSPVRRRPRRAAQPTTSDPVRALVERLASGKDDSQEDTDRAWIIRQLDAAVKARLSVELTVAQADGTTTSLHLEPTGVGGGRVRGRDRKSDIERTLPLSSIVAVGSSEA